MKKRILKTIGLLAGLSFLLSACVGGNPTSTGRPFEVLVVIEEAVWNQAAGKALQEVLDTDVPGLPQSEPSFRVMHVAPKHFDSTLKLIRNIVVVDIQNIYTKASFKSAKNLYADSQVVLTIQSPSEEELRAFVLENKNTIVDFLNRVEMNRQIAYLEKKHDNLFSQKVDSMFGLSMWIPNELMALKQGQSFVWASTNTATANRNV